MESGFARAWVMPAILFAASFCLCSPCTTRVELASGVYQSSQIYLGPVDSEDVDPAPEDHPVKFDGWDEVALDYNGGVALVVRNGDSREDAKLRELPEEEWDSHLRSEGFRTTLEESFEVADGPLRVGPLEIDRATLRADRWKSGTPNLDLEGRVEVDGEAHDILWSFRNEDAELLKKQNDD